MERLRFVLLFATFVATAQTSRGQEQQPEPAPSVQYSYVVVGDVETPDHFPLRGDTRTTVREAVVAAGMLSNAVSVSVLRATQERAVWTQIVSADAPDSGELVMDGDVLVVQAMTPVVVPYKKNAALRIGPAVYIVMLTSDTIAVGDVLQQTASLPTQEQLVSITCRFQGRATVAKSSLSDQVAHGDVITVSAGSRSSLSGFGSIVPAFSEWKEPAPSAISPSMSPGTMPETIKSAGDFSYSSSEQTDESPLQLPTPFAVPLMEPAEPVESAAIEDFDSGSTLSIPARPVSQLSPSAETVVAPETPIEIPVLSSDSAETVNAMSPWNLFFIGGCLIAGLLILAGSLKSDDSELLQATATSLQTLQPVATKEVATQPLESITLIRKKPLPVQSNGDASQGRAGFETTNDEASRSTVVADEEAVPQVNLISAGEWFGGDWRKRNHMNTTDPATVPDLPLAETASNVVTEEIGSAAASVTSGLADEKLIAEQSNFNELEDLLQNRLPIDLCETSLPLRISLFGRPSGPRRLRIDAAHPTLSGPHANMSAERKRDDQMMMSAARPATEKKKLDASGSLDRALHSLQERTES